MKSDENLQRSFAVKAMASVRFAAFAEVAERESYHQVALLLRALAVAEKCAATAVLRARGELRRTSENLTAAIDDKTHELSQLLPAFAQQADNEGNVAAGDLFRMSVDTAKEHAVLLNDAIDNMARLREVDYWVCQMCGLVEPGSMPLSCRVCGAVREKFMRIDHSSMPCD